MRKLTISLLTLSLVAGFAIFADAGIKDRLAKRLPAINKLKATGLVGENNKGYLEAKGKLSPEDKKVIEEENADRKKIYAMLAKKTGQSVDLVRKRRAAQIIQRSKAGIWLQKPDGVWYKK